MNLVLILTAKLNVRWEQRRNIASTYSYYWGPSQETCPRVIPLSTRSISLTTLSPDTLEASKTFPPNWPLAWDRISASPQIPEEIVSWYLGRPSSLPF